MNAAEWNALVYLVHNVSHEIDMASATAQGEMFVLGKMADHGFVDVRPGKRSPAYWINRQGLERIGVVIQ